MQQMQVRLEADQSLKRAQMLMNLGDYDEALHEYETVLNTAGNTSPADGALYGLGLIAVNSGNKMRHYDLAVSIFQRLLNEFPESNHARESQIWLDALIPVQKPEPLVIAATEKKTKKEVGPPKRQEIKLVKNNDFDAAIEKNRDIVNNSGEKPPADEALFKLGLILAHGENPNKDYSQAKNFFTRLLSTFPGSPYAEEAKIWVDTLGVIEKATLIDIEIEEKRKELSQ